MGPPITSYLNGAPAFADRSPFLEDTANAPNYSDVEATPPIKVHKDITPSTVEKMLKTKISTRTNDIVRDGRPLHDDSTACGKESKENGPMEHEKEFRRKDNSCAPAHILGIMGTVKGATSLENGTHCDAINGPRTICSHDSVTLSPFHNYAHEVVGSSVETPSYAIAGTNDNT